MTIEIVAIVATALLHYGQHVLSKNDQKKLSGYVRQAKTCPVTLKVGWRTEHYLCRLLSQAVASKS